MRSFADLPGAVSASEDSAASGRATAVLHFGNLFVEQAALASGGVVPRDDLRVLRLDGADRLSWLDSLSSQALAGLKPGESAETLILDPHGHIEQVLHVIDDGEASWLIVDAQRAAAAHNWLDRMRFRLEVRISDVSDQFAVLSQIGQPRGLTELLGSALAWRDPWPEVAAGGFAYASAATEPASNGQQSSEQRWNAVEWIVPRDRIAELLIGLQGASVPIAGLLAWQALRIAAGRPDAADLDEKALPHEFDWLRTAVHLNKGCYRGQETVAKLHNLGRPPRRLVLLHLDGSDSVLPSAGDEVWGLKPDGEPRLIGRVSSSAQHYELGPIALALVKRAVPIELTLEVRHEGSAIAATQQAVVPADAGPTIDIPRFPRLGIRT